MNDLGGIFGRIKLAMAGGRNPWGGGPKNNGESGDPAGGDAAGDGGDTPTGGNDSGNDGPRNPWLPGGNGGGNKGGENGPRRSPNIEDIFRNRGPEGPRRRAGGGGGGGLPPFRLPQRPGGKSWLPLGIAGVVLLWAGTSSVHQVGPKEQAVVTTFGKYSRTLPSGLNFTFPWPFQNVSVEPVSTIRSFRIPDDGTEKLILTGDQNLVDLSYVIRWNIKDLTQYRFQLAEPEETLREVAEAAMRASVAEQTLDNTFSGAGRATIELNVRDRMQALLDAYKAGIAVQGVEIDKTDPPERVLEAFKDVSAAEQDSDAARNRARAWAQQLLNRAQGDAVAFDKVYEQYRLAPEVTRQRMYYETMERVLSKTDKTIIEAEGVTPYLPLPEIRKRAQTPSEGE